MPAEKAATNAEPCNFGFYGGILFTANLHFYNVLMIVIVNNKPKGAAQ